MNPTNYYLPREGLGILVRKNPHDDNLPTLAESSSLTNNSYDLCYIFETLKDEPNAVDITVPNLTQWDKEQIVPVHDGNGCLVTTFKAKVEKEKMVFNKTK